MAEGALVGLRVIDFTWVGAGSFTTRLLAEHGADVIKIESSAHPDSLRLGPPFAGGVRGINRSGYFAERNANKRSVSIDLKRPRGVELVKRMLVDADVVANNFRPGVLDRLGLDYETVHALNPRIVYLSMSMQGSEGPDRNHVGYGITISALTGLTYLSAEPGRYPVGTGTHYPDHIPNPSHAALALMAAVRHQRRTGEGQLVELAQTEPTIAGLGPATMEWTALGRSPQPIGNRHPTWCPHGVFAAGGDDRWIALTVRDDDEWRALCRVLGLDDLHPLSLEERRQRVDEIEDRISAATRRREAAELAAQLQSHGVPAGSVADARDLFEDDEQLRHREHWRFLKHPEMGWTAYGRSPIRFSGTPGDLTRPAPLLGEHTVEVLTDLAGLTEAQIAELAADGVLR